MTAMNARAAPALSCALSLPACAGQQASEARLEPFSMARLERVMAVEADAHPHPWSRGNFIDSVAAGYECQLLVGGQDELLGYFVALRGVDEAHLLNLTVAPRHQRQGWAQVLLDALDLWARRQGLQWLWLEVRVSNTRAQGIYAAHGYRRVGLRKHYYPAQDGQREDAIVMSLLL